MSSTLLSKSSHDMAAELARRTFDIAGAAMGLVVLMPVFALLAVLIRLDSPGSVFYKSQRVGKDGRLFELYKFRSMAADAAGRGPEITTADDGRVTRMGGFLRRTKLDEFPQLINVLKGDMSLVGPRPEAPKYVALYTPSQRRVLSVRPGITSPASLAFRHEEELLTGPDWETRYCEEILPAKLAIDLAYLSQRSLLSDVMVILRTFLAILR